MPFKDYFSIQAKVYAEFRPTYPKTLFDYLTKLTPIHTLVWDVGTGNGQAAISLAEHFDQVIATDLSEAQLKSAPHKKNVHYRLMAAEKTDFKDESVDLITVAQALHWFDLEKFYQEAQRVLKPKGILAAWCYTLARVNPEIDAIIDRFYHEITFPYWPKERRYVDGHYQTISFPFPKLPTPQFYSEKEGDLNFLLGYLGSGSGVQAYIEIKHENPLAMIHADLVQAWKTGPGKKIIRWPIYLLVGIK